MGTAWRTRVRDFCESELRPHAADWARAGQVDRDLWRRAGKAGMLCPDVPTRYGGGGLGFADEVTVVEEQARVGDTAWGYTAHEVTAQYVLTFGTPGQRERWLPGLASGELVGAIAISEPGAGSDLGALRARADRAGDTYLLDATKTLLTNGGHADLVAVLATVDGAPGVLMVDTRGLDLPRTPIAKIGRHGQDTAELRFDAVRVPVADLLGAAPGQGMAQSMPMMSRERLLIAVAATAAMAAIVAQAVAWSRRRRVYGKALRRFQHTRFVLADCATEAAVARSFVAALVDRYVAGRLGVSDAAMAKLWTTERLCVVADRCQQLYGGLGYTAGHPAAEAWADARVTRIFGGASEVMKEIIAAGLSDRDGPR